MNYEFLKPAPETPAIKEAMARVSSREEAGLPVYDFSSGNIGRLLMKYEVFSDIDLATGEMPDEFRPISEAIESGVKKAFSGSPDGLSYSPTGGTDEQKRTAVKYFKEVHDLPIEEGDTDKVVVTAGGQQAMAAALRSVSPSGKVISPRWDYAPVTAIASDEEWEYKKLSPGDKLGFSLADLKEEADERTVFYTSMPNNPSGYVSPEKLGKACQVMKEAGGGIIWDAPYLFTMFRLEGGKARFDPSFLEREIKEFKGVAREYADRLCLLSSISKTCLSAGLRYGFACGPETWIQNINAILGRESLSSPTPSFLIGNEVLKAFLEEEINLHNWITRILARRVNYLLEKEIPLILPENGKFGALYVLMETEADGTEVADRLAEDGVVSIKAEPFFGKRVNAVRLSLVSVPYVEGDDLWKENVDKLAERR